MGILKKLFSRPPAASNDPHGIYFYVQCENCGEKLRIRADKRHDVQRDLETGRLTWRKEIMDGRCFRIMFANVVFSPGYQIETQEIEGSGHFITQEEYSA